ncbi:formylglycine-generating enzyme family protein [Chitinophaga parva]|nr:formylglycine-generating enzyme family protein [Chitinophaga parva]
MPLWLVCAAQAQTPERQGDLKELFKGPQTPAMQADWWQHMLQWRTAEKLRLQYKDTVYRKFHQGWTSRVFMYAQVMACDRFLYDPVHKRYTVDRYLADVKHRYGGLEAVLIWPTYPNIGIDNRNQFDWLASMPGGRDGVREMVRDFKQRGVRVFFPIMIWDTGTRAISNPMAAALIAEMQAVGADGLNGDTMFGVTEDFQQACDSIGYPVALQPEVAIDDLNMVKWNTMSWGYYWKYDHVPGVSVYKWLEPKHQVHITNRWIIDRTDDLQYAFFNGVGYNTWENIWGIWNGITERYAAAIKRIGHIYRAFPGAWSSAEWQPHFPAQSSGVFVSRFPQQGYTMYTLVNRDSVDKTGRQLQLPYQSGLRYFDIYNGRELHAAKEGDLVYLDFPVEANGFGAVLQMKSSLVDKRLMNVLAEMRQLSAKPLKSLSDRWTPLQQSITQVKKTVRYAAAPKGMVAIPGVKNYQFKTQGVMIEGNDLPDGIGVQHPWEAHPARSQTHGMDIDPFYMDKYPVTNKQFKAFLDATHYRPADEHNYLKDWKNGTYQEGWDDKPVTWVSLEDARAYASWAGKRLPHEWEWQYAGQGTDDRAYPWGNIMDSTLLPARDTGRVMRGPAAVNAFTRGASPFGVMDMVGNVWQWTDEYTDLHTRYAVLKGGGYYRPKGSDWYFPEATALFKYGKYLLMSPSMDRSGSVGFRCVADK